MARLSLHHRLSTKWQVQKCAMPHSGFGKRESLLNRFDLLFFHYLRRPGQRVPPSAEMIRHINLLGRIEMFPK